jgi:hypothetical protein
LNDVKRRDRLGQEPQNNLGAARALPIQQLLELHRQGRWNAADCRQAAHLLEQMGRSEAAAHWRWRAEKAAAWELAGARQQGGATTKGVQL